MVKLRYNGLWEFMTKLKKIATYVIIALVVVFVVLVIYFQFSLPEVPVDNTSDGINQEDIYIPPLQPDMSCGEKGC